jgi:hypothetical protein
VHQVGATAVEGRPPHCQGRFAHHSAGKGGGGVGLGGVEWSLLTIISVNGKEGKQNVGLALQLLWISANQ